MIIPLGDLTLVDLLPLLADAAAALDTIAQALKAKLLADIGGLGNVGAALTIAPPTVGANLAAVAQVAGELALTVSAPTATLQLAATLGAIAELQIALRGLVRVRIPTATVNAFVHIGDSATFGAEAQSATAPSSTHYALVIATTNANTWAQLGIPFALPGARLPGIAVPPLDIPGISVPAVSTPAFTLPASPAITVPAVSTPAASIGGVSLPGFTLAPGLEPA